MVNRNKLPKVANADHESQYGYVYGVSGPGMKHIFILINLAFELFSSRYC